MGAGILAAIGGGLTEGSIGSAVSGSSLGIIYGTAAGYKSGVRLWGGTVSFAQARRADIPLGKEKLRPLPDAISRTRIPVVSQDIADALESGVFGKVTGPYKIFQEKPTPFAKWVKEKTVAAQKAAQVQTGRFMTAGPALVACNY